MLVSARGSARSGACDPASATPPSTGPDPPPRSREPSDVAGLGAGLAAAASAGVPCDASGVDRPVTGWLLAGSAAVAESTEKVVPTPESRTPSPSRVAPAETMAGAFARRRTAGTLSIGARIASRTRLTAPGASSPSDRSGCAGTRLSALRRLEARRVQLADSQTFRQRSPSRVRSAGRSGAGRAAGPEAG